MPRPLPSLPATGHFSDHVQVRVKLSYFLTAYYPTYAPTTLQLHIKLHVIPTQTTFSTIPTFPLHHISPPTCFKTPHPLPDTTSLPWRHSHGHSTVAGGAIHAAPHWTHYSAVDPHSFSYNAFCVIASHKPNTTVYPYVTATKHVLLIGDNIGNTVYPIRLTAIIIPSFQIISLLTVVQLKHVGHTYVEITNFAFIISYYDTAEWRKIFNRLIQSHTLARKLCDLGYIMALRRHMGNTLQVKYHLIHYKHWSCI